MIMYEGCKIWEIAKIIQNDWKNPYFGAVPYIEALSTMTNIQDDYGLDSGSSIVAYFLANANTWRDTAREVKKELKRRLNVK